MTNDTRNRQSAPVSVEPSAPRGKGGLAHLVGRRWRILVLIGDTVHWVSAAELPIILATFPDADDVIAWNPQRFRTNTTHRLENLDTICYFVLDLDHIPIPLEELPEELEHQGFPEPWAILQSPSGDGAHVYWKLKPLYVGSPRPGETLEEARERRERGLGLYRAAAEAVVEALQDLGADPNCTSPTQLFRLNNTRVIFTSQRKTSLSELLVAARAHLRRRGRHRSRLRPAVRRHPVPTSERTGSVWDSPGIRWLREHVIPEGCRNSAIVALAIALFHDGHTEAEVRTTISRWAADHTEPRYSQRELRDAVRSLARRWARGEPLGLDPEKLCAIHDIRGQTMPREVAEATKTVLAAKTGARTQKPQRKPLAQRRKLPRIAWLPLLLQGESHRIPRTTRQRLTAVERYLNHLRQLAKSDNPLMGLGRREFLTATAKAGLWPSKEHSARSLAFWARREPGLWNSLLLAARDFLCALCGHRGRLAAPCTEPSERADRGFGPMGSEISADRGPRRESGLETGLVCLADLCKMNHGGER